MCDISPITISPITNLDKSKKQLLDYYISKFSYINSIFTNKNIPKINFKDKEIIFPYIAEIFPNINNGQLIYSFKTDVTKYFSHPTIKEYVNLIIHDINRLGTKILYNNSQQNIIDFNITDTLDKYKDNTNSSQNPNYLVVLNYSICLLNTFFNTKLSVISNDLIDLIDNNSINTTIIDDEPNKQNPDKTLFKSFTEVNIPISDSAIDVLNKIKCVLSNLIFTNQSYMLFCFTILVNYYKNIIDYLNKHFNDEIILNFGSSILIINSDNKTFNFIYDIVCSSPNNIVLADSLKIGKLTHVIHFNTLEDITSGKLNDSYIIIETFKEFNTAKNFLDYINRILAFNAINSKSNTSLQSISKKRKIESSSLFNKLFSKTQTNHQNTILSSYFNAVPKQNYSRNDNAKKLYKEMSSFILTDNIATIFNFLIHISPYKSFITNSLFNLNEKITYLTNRKNEKEYDSRTVDNFDFDTSEKFDVYNGGMNEDAYKMFFCTKKLNFEIYKSLLGEKLFNFFSETNDKHLFVGFIMNYPKEWIPSIVKKFAHDGHMNSFIIDKKNKIIIRFEPKGKESPYYCNVSESEFKQYIIDSLIEYENKTKMTVDNPKQKIALPANINVGELNNNTASLIDHDSNNRNNRDIYNNTEQIQQNPKQQPHPQPKSEYYNQAFLNQYMGKTQNNNNNNLNNKHNNLNHNNSIIPTTPSDQHLPLISKAEINTALHDEFGYNNMINEYTYIDTSDIKNIDKLTKKSNGNKNNYTINSYKAPQTKIGDDYCQTYSLYGALLYCMNADSIANFNTERKKAVYSTIKLFEQITQTQEKVINLQAFIKEKLLIFMPGLMNQAIEGVKLQYSTKKSSNHNNNYDIIAIGNNETEQMKEPVQDKPIPLLKYTDEIKQIDSNLQKILDIIQGELRDRSSSTKNNRTVITKMLRYYIDNLQTTPYNSNHNSQTNAKVKIQYLKKKKSLGIFSKSKIHETLEAQNYYKLLLEANFFSKIITLLNNDINYHTNNERKQSMLLRFNKFLDKNPKYSNDIFNKATNEILTAIDTLKRMNNKTRKNIQNNSSRNKTQKNNAISNSGDINKVDINTLNTETQKKKIKDIIDYFLAYECNSNKLVLSVEDKDICDQISIHRRNLDYAYTDYLNSQKILSKTKKNKKSLEQIYYRLLLECDLISQILSFDDKKIKLIEKVSMIKYLLDSIKNKPNYSISIFTNIKRDIIQLVKSPHLNTKNNISRLLKTHRLI